MKTAVVVLNWNTERLLKAFLPGVAASCGPETELVVADSGSSDGSLEYVKGSLPQVRTVVLGENLGFAGGYNRVLGMTEAEYFVLLNSDVEVSPGWLEPLVEYMDTHPGCGVCAPKLHALVKDGESFRRTSIFEYAGAAGGYIDRFGFPFCRGRVLSRTEEVSGQYDGGPGSVLWVSGACMMVRSSLWRALGGFDGRFFAHMEEIDFCWRARLQGFDVVCLPGSTVWHLGGGTLAAGSPVKLGLNFRNNLLMLENNLPSTVGAGRARCIIRQRMLIDLAAAAAYLLKGRPKLCKAVLSAHRDYRRLRRTGPGGEASVRGYWNKCIILQSVLRGNGIFKYLRRYENSY